MSNKEELDVFDFAVIGAGVTGLSAGMYAGRMGLKSIVFGKSHGSELSIGGVITTTNIVENYPGFIRLTGTELADKIRDHALDYKDFVKIKEEGVLDIVKKKNIFVIKTNKGEYLSRTITFATGTKWRKLEVKGSLEFENKGVAYCALCDAPLYRNKIVAVVGGSDSATKDALLIAEHVKKVYIIYRGEKIHPEPINLKRVLANKKIEILNNTNIVEIKGEKFVKSVILDRVYNGSKELVVEGVFVAIGHLVLSELAKKMGVKTNKKEEIIIDHKTSETNIPGIYAAGDVADKPFKQAITGVAEGCTAAYSAFEYISKEYVIEN